MEQTLAEMWASYQRDVLSAPDADPTHPEWLRVAFYCGAAAALKLAEDPSRRSVVLLEAADFVSSIKERHVR